ncbi:zinc-dependent alcohol dehydrogenase family protein [Muricauda sp. 2012CJ35-5]|uniref:Zinc-dependent alcohol dehydrogenase family protein n=1 Tax=Flagellimonas spongiicola TaxID=2942208 RepID=A0ABT0PN86_9FLAO|nr:zinc-dependent alcohol dehydrogenase family protein [Allomuricauda spongiicola]MCL6272828.1 zinc-dependent alcohol dehydrogenase family protein [Allomuricauda spongiicola]
MKAAVYENFQGKIQVMDVPIPKPMSHGVLLKIKATGMCLSDWHGWIGHDPDIILPHVPGHELAGEIVETGKDVINFKVGDRVTVPFVGGCGSCYQCHSGNHQVCDNQSQPGFTHWGSFAEYMILNHADLNLVKLPDEINDETASILGCRFITSFRAVVEQGNLKGGEFVAVHGCGGVGLSAIMIAHASGAQVIAVDINDDALELAENLGAVITINSLRSLDVVDEVKEFTKGGAHLSIDALGHQQTCFNSIANLRKRGKHIQVGLMTGDDKHPSIPMDQVIAEELEILGSHGMQAFKYGEMLKMIQSGKLRPELLIERTISLDQSVDLLPKMDQFKNSGVTIINSF